MRSFVNAFPKKLYIYIPHDHFFLNLKFIQHDFRLENFKNNVVARFMVYRNESCGPLSLKCI